MTRSKLLHKLSGSTWERKILHYIYVRLARKLCHGFTQTAFILRAQHDPVAVSGEQFRERKPNTT